MKIQFLLVAGVATCMFFLIQQNRNLQTSKELLTLQYEQIAGSLDTLETGIGASTTVLIQLRSDVRAVHSRQLRFSEELKNLGDTNEEVRDYLAQSVPADVSRMLETGNPIRTIEAGE